MPRFEILDSDAAPLGEGPAAADMLFELGMMYSVGRDMPVDLISAHKWFNLAAMKGNLEAPSLSMDKGVIFEGTCKMEGGKSGSTPTPLPLGPPPELPRR